MANPFDDTECEAIALLGAGNPMAFRKMLDYFERMYAKEMIACVDCNIDVVDIHRGKARAWRDAKNIHVDATKRLNS